MVLLDKIAVKVFLDHNEPKWHIVVVKGELNVWISSSKEVKSHTNDRAHKYRANRQSEYIFLFYFLKVQMVRLIFFAPLHLYLD